MALASTSWKPGYSGNPDTPPLTSEELQAFLDLLAEAHTVSYAASVLGRRRDTFWDHKRRDPAFADAWDKALEARGDWHEERLRAKEEGKAAGDTVAIIVGLKMTGRFVEKPATTQIQVNIGENRPFQQYSVEQLKAQLDALEKPVIEVLKESNAI
jgi:hypothetical protein